MSGEIISRQWLTVPLEEVILRIVGGGTPSKSKPEYYQGEIPWMSVKDMNKHVLEDTADHISPAAVENSSTNVIPSGTPIIATRMSLGKIVVANFDSAINQDLKALFLPAEIHRDYLVYWYRSVARSIEQMGTGTTVKGIRLEAVKGLKFALPPLTEQKVIADKLDTLLAQVENTKARLERIPQILKRFRQSVLAAAVSGRLLEGINFTPSDSQTCKFEEILRDKKKLSYGVLKPGDFDENGTPMIRVMDIGEWGEFNNTEIFKISNKLSQEYGRTIVQKGDIVLSVMATIGRPAIVPAALAGANVNRALAVIKLREGILPEYVQLQLLSPFFQEAFVTKQIGSAQKRINLSDLRQFDIWLPDQATQSEIVHRVDQLFSHADQIEQKANNALARVDNLTQSILAKAFQGELTEQWRRENPELISGENSAGALLERIRNEREITTKQRKKRKTGIKKKTGKSMAEKLTVVEALKRTGEPLSGQQLLAASGYPSDSNTEDLESFFLDLRDATLVEKTVVRLDRDDDGQDWFALTENDDQPVRKG